MMVASGRVARSLFALALLGLGAMACGTEQRNERVGQVVQRLKDDDVYAGASLRLVPGLEDFGGPDIPNSPDPTDWPFLDESETYVMRHFSWFEQSSLLKESFGTSFPTNEQLEALAGVIGDLKGRTDFSVVVRYMTTPAILASAMQTCDEVFVLAHGLDKGTAPHVRLPFAGVEELGTLETGFPAAGKQLAQLGIFACFGTTSAKTLELRKDATRYYSPTAGTQLTNVIVQQLIDALVALRDAPVSLRAGGELPPRRICILAADFGSTRMYDHTASDEQQIQLDR